MRCASLAKFQCAHIPDLKQSGVTMIKLLVIFGLALVLANYSEQYTRQMQLAGRHYSPWNDRAFLLLVAALVLFSGMRKGYNDTASYIRIYQNYLTLDEFFADPENFNIFTNPLFYFYISLLKTLNADPQVLIFTTSLFTQLCFMLFLKRYSPSFLYSVFLYFTLGTFTVSLAAMKQVVAMAILTLAFPALEKRQWVKYYLLVFIAMLMHTYALAFAILPLFTQRPWKLFTYLFVFAMVVLMMNFRGVISEFMDQANELGKTLEEYEVFDDHTVNLLRLLVYAVPPLISLVFQRWIFQGTTKTEHLLIHLCIISLAFMSMGTQAGANMFARMAHYFEIGTLCCLPFMLKRTFEEKSYRLVSAAAVFCFLVFFVYSNAINMRFDQQYEFAGFLSIFN